MIPKGRIPKALGFVLLGGLTFAIPSIQAAERIVAYVVPAATPGNQDFSGVIGMEFDVANPIVITQLGVFDDNGDGLQRTITARIFNRSDPSAPVEVISMDFTPEEPGTLIGGSRFKPLPTPLRLELGFQGTIAAENYGAEERLRNAGIGNSRNWSVNDGNGSLAFVGTSRYGTVNGAYPDVADGGPADRYAAGTFEFETTPPLTPGVPTGLDIEPGDATIKVRWLAVTNPLPAAKYEIRRAVTPTGEYTKVGEATALEFSDVGLSNGQGYCYKVRGVGAGGQQGADSPPICAAPYLLPAGQNVVVRTKAGVPGTQNFDGVIGIDFSVANAVLVTHLGVFDDGSDGLGRAITARLWNRADPDAPVEMASLEFTPENPGTLIGGSRFLPLPSPVRLEPGFQGTISAENYGAEERLYNPGGDPLVDRPWTVETGGSSLLLTGIGRYGTVAGEFPGTPDGGASDRYGAGTFQFQTTSPVNPGIPIVTAAGGDRSVALSWSALTEPVAAAKYRIMRGPPDGALAQIAEVTSPNYTDEGLTKNTDYCYTVAGVTAGGQVGIASARSCLFVEAREPGVAYIVETGAVGSQNFGGALGLDFDVSRAVTVTRLGVFDDASDGLFLPINARLYNRDTLQIVAQLDFSTDSAGDLVGGNRFKNLTQPITLPAGFKGTMVASGYGDDERNGNVNGPAEKSVFGGGGSLVFVGTARYGVDPAGYPNVADGGPANRYAAGTFYFEPAAEAPTLAISRSGTKLAITWTGAGTLESAPTVTGAWAAVPGATSGVQVDPTGAASFYRIKQ